MPVIRHLKTYVLESICELIKFNRKLSFKFRLLKLKVGIKFTDKIPVFNISVDVAVKLYRIYVGINLTLCVPCNIFQCVNDQRDAKFL